MVYCTQKVMLPWLQQCSLGLHKSLFEIKNTVVMSLGFQMKEQLTVVTMVWQPFKKIIQLLV